MPASGGVTPFNIAFKVDMNNATQQAASEANKLAKTVMGAYAKLGAVGMGVATGAITTVAGLATTMAVTIGAASKFEDSFAGIKKTVDASEEDFRRLAVSVRTLATEIPIATNQLNQIGELGGQLGIEATGLPTFIETIAKLGVATRLSTDTAALALARLKTIFQLSNNDISRLGSSLVDLGNNFAALEDEILSTALRLAAGAKVAGATAADTLAIATALQAVGVQSQAGGTAVARVFQQITTAVQGGQKELDVFARVSGLLPDQFKRLAENDPAQAFNVFLQGLSRISDEGGNVVTVLEQLGLKQQRTIRALLALSEAGDLVTETLARGNAAYQINNALTEEAAKRFETLKSQTKLMKNAFTELRIEIGNAFLPLAKAITQTLTGVAVAAADDEKSAEVGLNKMSNSLKVLTAGFFILGAAISTPIAMFFKMVQVQTIVNTSTEASIKAMSDMTRKQILMKVATETNAKNLKDYNKHLGKSTVMYAQARMKLMALLPQLALLTVAFAALGIANARANKNAEASAKLFVESSAAFIPLQTELNKKIREFEDLKNQGYNADVLKVYQDEIRIIKDELDDLNTSTVKAFLNIPKFMKDVTGEEAKRIADAYGVLGQNLEFIKGVADFTLPETKTQVISGVEVEKGAERNILSGIIDVESLADENIAERIAEILNIELKVAENLLSEGDLTSLLQIMAVKGIEDSSVFESVAQVITNQTIAISKAYNDSQKNASKYTEEERRKLYVLNNQAKPLLELTNRMRNLDSENEFLTESTQGLIDRYNALDASERGATVTLEQFTASSEIADRVINTLYGNIDKAAQVNKSFKESIVEASIAIQEQLDKLGELGQAYSELSEIVVPTPDDILAGAQEIEERMEFINAAVAVLVSQGQIGLAYQIANIKDTGQAFGLAVAYLQGVGKDVDIFANINDQQIKLNATAEGLTGTTEQNSEALRDQLLTTRGLTTAAQQREAIEKAQLNLITAATNARKQEIQAMIQIFNMNTAIKERNREMRDLQREIAELTSDIVFGNIVITKKEKETLEVELAREEVLATIAQYGEIGVVTDNEKLNILQMQLSLDKMRDKISQKMSARDKKNIADKKKEIKFLELAVEQGVAEQLDLDVAREELAAMQAPMSQIEKDILDLQIKAAEAELAAARARADGLSPEVISAIESYNNQLKVGPERLQKIVDTTDKYNTKLAENKLKQLENGVIIEGLLAKYPNLNQMIQDTANALGIPASYAQESLVAMNTEYGAFLQFQTDALTTFQQNTLAGLNQTKTVVSQTATQISNIINGIQMFANPYQPNTYQSGTQGIIGQGGYYTGRRNTNANPFTQNPTLSAIQRAIQQGGGSGGYYGTDLNRAYGGMVPIGRTSVVGELGPEKIMSLPGGGTMVFENKGSQTAGSGITVQTMNVNITGIPTDPITARKAAINIRRELTKLEKEGNAGTGLRNR